MAEDEVDGEPSVVIPFPKSTPQERGRKYERRRAREQGLREHPASGAGKIKHDASDDNRLVEYKTATKTFTLSGKYLADFFRVATRQSKQAIMEVDFETDKVVVEITIRRTNGR